MIKINNLTLIVGKENKQVLLEDVNLTIPSNQITAIVGPSGVGKTTLLHQIANIIKPTSSSIKYYDKNQQEINSPHVDLVFQDFNLFDNLNVMENIEVGNGLMGLGVDKDLFEKQVEQLNIKNNIINSDVKTISGGEKQRVAILRALSRQADFILLDEPTGNLDFETSELIFDTIKQLSHSKTIVIVSHNYELVAKYADKIVRIQDAKLIVEKEATESNSSLIEHSIQNKLLKPSTFTKLKLATKFVKNDLKTKDRQGRNIRTKSEYF